MTEECKDVISSIDDDLNMVDNALSDLRLETDEGRRLIHMGSNVDCLSALVNAKVSLLEIRRILVLGD